MARRRRAQRKQNPTEADRISELPDPILHLILSHLPIKEAAKTCLLSKRWRRLCFSLPVLDFSTSPVHFVDGFLWNYDKDMAIDVFRLKIEALSMSSVTTLNTCLGFVVSKNVKELNLSLNEKHFRESCVWYTLPRSVFISPSLTVLKLNRCDISSKACIHLPRLKLLSLARVDLDDKTLTDLVFNSPCLEMLYIEACYGLFYGHIQSTSLRSLQVVDYYIQQFHKLEIVAPLLVSFLFKSGCWVSNTHRSDMSNINIASCKALEVLSLEGVKMTDKQLYKLIYHFCRLESLNLLSCNTLVHVKIFSPNLKRLNMRSCSLVQDAEIATPDLLWFSYHGKLISVYSATPLTPREVELDIECNYNTGMEWFVKVHGFLRSFNYAETLSLGPSITHQLLFAQVMGDCLLPPLDKLKKLHVNLWRWQNNKNEYLKMLLWLCPSLEVLTIYVDNTQEYLTFLDPSSQRGTILKDEPI